MWENIYYGNVRIEARALIESPINTNELIVVGRYEDQSSGLAMEAFFLHLDANTGGVINLICYSDGLKHQDLFSV